MKISGFAPVQFPFAGRFILALALVGFAAPMISNGAVYLKTTDAFGYSSFNTAGNWSDSLPPHAGADYLVGVQFLRTPADANSYTFAGDSLTITNGGGMIYKGTASANTYTIRPLVLDNGGLVRSGAGSGNTMILAGTISVLGNSASSEIRADQSPYLLNSAISGTGSLRFSGGYQITLNGTNSSTGNTSVSGRITWSASSLMLFTIGANGINNSISGSGAATLNGAFAFDLSGASTNVGDSWTIAGTATQIFGGAFRVNGFGHLGGGSGPGIWQGTNNGAFYSFDTSSGVLQVVAVIDTNLVTTPTPVFAAPVEADLLAAYAPSYAASVGGQDNAQVIIANAVAGSNQIQDHSGTGARMRIAGFYQSANDVINQTTVGGIVNWLANNSSQLSDVVSQGAAVGADLVVYICQDTDSASIAGVSQQPGMYSSLSPSAVWSAVLAHETGGHAYGRSHSDGLLNPKTIMLHNYCGGGAAPPYFYTNPKIWFNGVQLLGDGVNNCSMGPLINGGDNSSCSAQAVADRRERVVTGPDLSHVILNWSFTNAPGPAPAGTTNFDLISAVPAVVRGNGAFYTGSALRIPGGTTGDVPMTSMSAYIDLPNGLISSQTNITIEIWATPLSAPNWARIMDFGRATQAGDGLGAPGEYTGDPGDPAPGTTTASDDIMLSAAIGTDITQQRFESRLNGVATTLDANLATVAGMQHYYAITFTDGTGAYGSAGGRWEWYRDGDAVAYLDVSNHLAAYQDVNDWLGRSQWSADSLANNDYAEVRISDVAMSRGRILANYGLGPNYVPAATVMLTNSDAAGASSFNTAGQWSSSTAPAAGQTYETYDYRLRTPPTSSSYVFGGDALAISGGSLLWSGTSSSTITVGNLTLNNGTVRNSGSGTVTFGGNFTITNSAVVNADDGPINLSASLGGSGPITFLGNPVSLSGTNRAFAGKLFIGDGAKGTVVIDSPARLGASPPNFVANQLDLNRGTLQTTATLSLDDPNRGILLDISGGTFNVAPGTTLTLTSPLSSPPAPSGYNVVAGALTKANSGVLILNSPSNTFKGTLYVDTGSSSANDGVVRVADDQVLAAAHSPIFINNNNSGSSSLQLDGTGGNITLPQQIALNGRNRAVAAIENVAGTNTISGGISINVGGGNYWVQSDAGQLNLGGASSSAASGSRTFTFLGNGNHNVTGVIANGNATVSVAKSGDGTLILAGNNTYSGTTVLNGGTLLVNGTVSSGAVTASGGTLGGNGTINGPVTMQSGATFAPGTSAMGGLTINNSLTLAAGSTTRVRISKTNNLTSNDFVAGLDSVACGGTITVSNLGATALTAGDTFRIFSAARFDGTFATVTLPALGTNFYWINRLAVDGTLSVGSALPTNIVWNLSGTSLSLSWPADHIGWHLEAQTNSLGTNWFPVSGSTTTNRWLVPIDSTQTSVFYRLVYP